MSASVHTYIRLHESRRAATARAAAGFGSAVGLLSLHGGGPHANYAATVISNVKLLST